MIRISTIFIGICMVLIAASLGLVVNRVAGLSGGESAIVALTALTVMLLYNAVSLRLRDRGEVGGQIAGLSNGTADLARQVAEFGRRLAVVEGKIVSAHSAGQDRIQHVMGEINELAGLVKQLAGSVASHDDMLAGGAPAGRAESASPPLRTASPPAPASFALDDLDDGPEGMAVAASSPSPAPPPLPVSPQNDAHLLASVERAIEANRIDIYLQPMVTLPQRKVRFYEAMSRLRDDNDQVLTASDFIDAAEAAGLMGRIDHAVMLRCMQVLRRLMVRNKDVGIFCNVAASTLHDTGAFGQCLEFLEANRALAPSFILEFRQSTFRALGPIESENLAALAQRGFRFSIDNVTDLRINPRELADLGVRFIKVPAALLLDSRQSTASDIDPADLAALLGRQGIDLVAERIEGERAVVDLLDCDVRFGQGFLFAAPRPLRPDAGSATADQPTNNPGASAGAPQDTHGSGHFPPLDAIRGESRRGDGARSDPARTTGNAALARRAGPG